MSDWRRCFKRLTAAWCRGSSSGEGIAVEYVLYMNLSDSLSIYREAECNKGIDQVTALLDEVRRRGEAVQIRNSAEMSKEELMMACPPTSHHS